MATQGPLAPGTIDNGSTTTDASTIGFSNSISWSNSGNVATENASYSTATFANYFDGSYNIHCTNFGFTVPGGADIDGIVVEVKGHGGGTSNVYVFAQLILDGVRTGTNPAGGALGSSAPYLPSSNGFVTFGSSTSMWGQTLEPRDIRDKDFGVAVGASTDFNGSRTASIDFVRMTVYYSAPTVLINEDGDWNMSVVGSDGVTTLTVGGFEIQ